MLIADMSQKLTPKLVRKLYPEQNSKDVEKLELSNKDIKEVCLQFAAFSVWILHTAVWTSKTAQSAGWGPDYSP